MPKTHEEKREKFNNTLAVRLPKAEKAILLLKNLSRKSDYAWTNAEMNLMVNTLDHAFDEVMKAFGLDTPEEEPAPAPTGPMLTATEIEERPLPPAAGAVSNSDKTALKNAYMTIKRGDIDRGMKQMSKVFLGWDHITEEHEA